MDTEQSQLEKLLENAASSGNLDMVQNLVAKGSNPNPQHGGITPLHAAAMFGHVHVMDFLVSKGANVNAKHLAMMGATPLHAAALEGQANAVTFLLTHGADPEARMTNGATPMDLAGPEHMDIAMNIAAFKLARGGG